MLLRFHVEDLQTSYIHMYVHLPVYIIGNREFQEKLLATSITGCRRTFQCLGMYMYADTRNGNQTALQCGLLCGTRDKVFPVSYSLRNKQTILK